MKKTFLFFVLIALISCTKNQETKVLEKIEPKKELTDAEIEIMATKSADSAIAEAEFAAQSEVDGKSPLFDKAKSLLIEASELVSNDISNNNASKIEVNKKLKSIMDEYDKIFVTLNFTEKKYLENYRLQLLEKTIDLQVEKSK